MFEQQEEFILFAEGNACLHLACSKGHIQLLRPLITHGAIVNHRNAQQETPLLFAIRSMGQTRIANPTEHPTFECLSVLMETLQYVGADMEAQDHLRRNIFHLAVLYDVPEVFAFFCKGESTDRKKRELIQRLFQTHDEFHMPVHLAVVMQRLGCFELLMGFFSFPPLKMITRPQQDTVYHLIAQHIKDEDACKAFFLRAYTTAMCTEMNSVNCLDSTPLHAAVLHNNLHAAHWCLKLGARTDVKNVFDQTPLQVSTEIGAHDLTGLLQSHEQGAAFFEDPYPKFVHPMPPLKMFERNRVQLKKLFVG